MSTQKSVNSLLKPLGIFSDHDRVMSSLPVVDAAIQKIQQKISKVDFRSESFSKLVDQLSQLKTRRELLKTYSEEEIQRIEIVNAEINKRKDDLEGERKERIASIKYEYKDKIAELPEIDEVELAEETDTLHTVESSEQIQKFFMPSKSASLLHLNILGINDPTKTMDKTARTIYKYKKTYFYNHPETGWENFCHATAYSFFGMYECRPSDITHKFAQVMLDKVSSQFYAKAPISLAAVDVIIHSDEIRDRFFVVFDTSLQVILTNFARSKFCQVIILLIYDGDLKLFVPIPYTLKTGKIFCNKCFRFTTRQHKCELCCPICLRRANYYNNCSEPPKPFSLISDSESAQRACQKCHAICRNLACLEEHSKICPRPRSKFHDNVIQYIESLNL